MHQTLKNKKQSNNLNAHAGSIFEINFSASHQVQLSI